MSWPFTEEFSCAQSCGLGQLASPGKFLHCVEFVEFQVAADANESVALRIAAA